MPMTADQEYEKIIKKRLSERRFAHSMNVAQSARALALQYGANPQKAYTAGILHDIMKEASREEQLQTIEKAGILLTPVEQVNPKLWHAISGMAYVRDTLGVEDEEILMAIRYHTTAKADMELLSKVLYIADFISAERDYEGVEEMRAVAKRDLDAATLEGLRFSIEDLAKNSLLIHPDSLAGYNQLLLKNYRCGGLE